jgi:site-specific recombinase XerD
MRCAGAAPYGLRARALVVLLWRAGLRVSAALALAESDLDRSTGGVLVRLAKGGKRRRVAMDPWGWQQLQPWLDRRRTYRRATMVPFSGPPDAASLGRPKQESGAVSHRINFRHTHAVEMAREGIPVTVIQRQLGQHANLGVTSIYLQGIDQSEVIDTVYRRPAPMLPARTALH